MATHSSVPAWKILWTKEPGRKESDMTEGLTHTQDRDIEKEEYFQVGIRICTGVTM